MLPDLSTLWVVAFVLLLVFILDRLFFRPVTRVMAERAQTIHRARDDSRTALDRWERGTQQYHEAIQAARAEGYRLLDERRREAVARRDSLVERAREDAQRELQTAIVELRTQAARARVALADEAEALAGQIADRVLGRAG